MKLSLTFFCALALFFAADSFAAETVFKAGAVKRDITPKLPVPMWGYGARHSLLSGGTLDPLEAAVVVIQAGNDKLAIVGLGLGWSPSEKSLQNIRQRIKSEAGIEHSFIAGSQTHHGPVLELSDADGKGKGRFDAAIRYYQQLEDEIVATSSRRTNRTCRRSWRPARLNSRASIATETPNRNRSQWIAR